MAAQLGLPGGLEKKSLALEKAGQKTSWVTK